MIETVLHSGCDATDAADYPLNFQLLGFPSAPGRLHFAND